MLPQVPLPQTQSHLHPNSNPHQNHPGIPSMQTLSRPHIPSEEAIDLELFLNILLEEIQSISRLIEEFNTAAVGHDITPTPTIFFCFNDPSFGLTEPFSQLKPPPSKQPQPHAQSHIQISPTVKNQHHQQQRIQLIETCLLNTSIFVHALIREDDDRLGSISASSLLDLLQYTAFKGDPLTSEVIEELLSECVFRFRISNKNYDIDYASIIAILLAFLSQLWGENAFDYHYSTGEENSINNTTTVTTTNNATNVHSSFNNFVHMTLYALRQVLRGIDEFRSAALVALLGYLPVHPYDHYHDEKAILPPTYRLARDGAWVQNTHQRVTSGEFIVLFE